MIPDWRQRTRREARSMSNRDRTRLETREIIERMESLIQRPEDGLQEDIFLFVSRITPLVNVDLLIKDTRKRTLLTWRDDGFYPAGWHIPGGIVRFKERWRDRIHAVAAAELGAKVRFEKAPLAIREVVERSRRVRGHFVSLLFACELISPLDEQRRYRRGRPRAGEWAWHKERPKNLLAVHRMYRRFM